MTGLFIPNAWHISFLLLMVAVAVSAISCTRLLTRLRISLMCENSFLKSLPLMNNTLHVVLNLYKIYTNGMHAGLED